MKPWLQTTLFVAGLAVLVAAWLVYFHNDAVASSMPQWGWVQASVKKLGEAKTAAAEEDEDPDNTKNEIPVHTTKVRTQPTMRRYVDGYGMVIPKPSREGKPAGGANLASPVAGVVAKVIANVGQKVKAKDPLLQLDDRVARAAEEQAAAAMKQEQLVFDALKASQPQQLQVAELSVEKSKAAVDFAERTYERLKTLAAAQGVTGKTVEQAAVDLATARVDLANSQKTLALMKPESVELKQEEAKLNQVTAAYNAAKTQRELMTLASPIDGTVVAINANPGDSVDATRVLVQVVALDQLAVDVDIPAELLPEKVEGLAVQIFAPPAVPKGSALPDKPPRQDEDNAIMGKVEFASPQADPKSGAVLVAISLPADSGLKPGASVHARIIAEEHKDVLVVPRKAVTTDENGDPVIAVVEGSQATHKHVTAGIEEGGLIEIAPDADIKEGTVVVTAGAYGLPAASRVKVVGEDEGDK
jgi:RND family efflux transporter MFP subunit